MSQEERIADDLAKIEPFIGKRLQNVQLIPYDKDEKLILIFEEGTIEVDSRTDPTRATIQSTWLSIKRREE